MCLVCYSVTGYFHARFIAAFVRLALVGIMPEHYCINTHHLLGEFATKKRHLEKLGYVVVEVSALNAQLDLGFT